MSDIQYTKVKRFVEFVLIATIIHEFGHCLTKHLFGSQFLTPSLPALVGSDKQDPQLGEIGQDIEMGVFGCIVVLEWADSALFHNSERLWHVDKLIGWVKIKNTLSKWFILSTWIAISVDHLLSISYR